MYILNQAVIVISRITARWSTGSSLGRFRNDFPEEVAGKREVARFAHSTNVC